MQQLNKITQLPHEEDLKRKKRAIYIALLNYLNPEQAGEATDIWLNEYSDKSAFELQSFISKITAEFNVTINRKEVQLSIVKMLLNDTSDSNSDNYEYLGKETYAADLQASHIIFLSLITQWLKEVDLINANQTLNIKRYIATNLLKLELSFDEVMKIKTWLNTYKNNIYIKNLSFEQMKKIFHFCYVGSCEYIGPVQTDKIISEVVKIIEQMPEANNFSPKEFF
jgi:hypothetical protein